MLNRGKKNISEGSSYHRFLEIRSKMFSSLLWKKDDSGKAICSGFMVLYQKNPN